MHNIPVTLKLGKKFITNLLSSRVPGADFVPVVVLRNCEPELSYILAELFNMCLKESCFPDCWKISSVVPVFMDAVFKNVGERSTAKNYRPVKLFLVVSKIFTKFVNNKLSDNLEKCGLFSISSMVSGLVSDRTGEAFNRSQATRAVIYPRLSTGFGILVFFINSNLMEFQVGYSAIFLLFSVIDGLAPFLVLPFSNYTLMTFLLMTYK